MSSARRRSPSIRWRRPLVVAVALLGLSAAGACRSRTLDTAAPRLPAGVPPSPPSPQLGLPIPAVDAVWRPPSLIAGDLDGLQRVVDGRRVVVHAPSWTGSSSGRQRARTMVDALGGVFVGTGARPLDVVTRAGALDLERIAPASDGPRYRYSESMLAPRWRDEALAAEETELVVFVDAAPIEREAWQALDAYAVGTCEPTLQALAAGQEESLAYLEAFLDHADAWLTHRYRQEMAPRAAAGLERLSAYKAKAPSPGVATKSHACGQAMRTLLQEALCDEGEKCASAPRIVLRQDAIIAALEPAPLPESDCAQRVGYDAIAEIANAERAATRTVSSQLDVQWSELASRVAALTTVYDAVWDTCTPRRRRYAPEDLDEIRRRQNKVHAILEEDPRTSSLGQWRRQDESMLLTTQERLRVFARFDAGPGAPASRARGESVALREFALAQAQCMSEPGGVPLAVLVADVESDRVAHFGFYFAEELSCSGLGPRTPESNPDADGL